MSIKIFSINFAFVAAVCALSCACGNARKNTVDENADSFAKSADSALAAMSETMNPDIGGNAQTVYSQNFAAPDALADFVKKFELGPNPKSTEKPSAKIIRNKAGTELEIDSLKVSGAFVKNLTLALPKGTLCEISFDCLAERAETDLNATIDSFKKGARKVLSARKIPVGKRVKVRVSAATFTDADSRFALISEGGAKLKISNVKVRQRAVPEVCRWMFAWEVFDGMKIAPTHLSILDFKRLPYSMGEKQFFPFVDKFGQYKHGDWEDKTYCENDLVRRAAEEKRVDEVFGAVPQRDRFGGLADKKFKRAATGFFRFEKVGGKWFFVDPEGNLFWSLGVCGVGHTAPTVVGGREKYFDDISGEKYAQKTRLGKTRGYRQTTLFDFARKNIDIKYGANAAERYPLALVRRMKAWGLNTCSAWSTKDITLREQIPFAVVSTPVWSKTLKIKGSFVAHHMDFPEVFNDDFETKTKRNLSRWHSDEIKSKWCLGVFMGNEFSWQSEVLRLPRAILTCPKTQESKIALCDFLKAKYGSIEKLNSQWNSNYADWKSVLARRDFIPTSKSADADLLAFERKLYERFFKVCRDAVKAVNPDALFLGCKFGWKNPLLEIVASEFCDAVSINSYKFDYSKDSLPEGARDVPIIIGEFHYGTLDKGVFGGGLAPAKTFGTRNAYFANAVKSALANPAIAGMHWYQFVDQPTSGARNTENFSIGFVDICDTPDESLAKTARAVSERIYSLRLDGVQPPPVSRAGE